MVAYLDFKSRVLNNGYDHDGGAFGWQCWDGFAELCEANDVPIINTDHINHSGYAKDLWELRKTNGMLTYFDEVETMEGGDVAVFKEVAGVTPSSHVAIFDSDIDGTYGWFLGQNQGGIPYAGGGSAFNLVMLPYSAIYPTAFRIKMKVEVQTPMGVKNVNGDIYSDLITNSRSEIFGNWGIRDLSSVKYIVIHGTLGQSVQNAVDTWTVGGRDASANYIVHEKEIVGCVGENYTAWHCGGQDAITNQNSIGVEHVNNKIDGANSTFSAQTIDSGAKLVAEICKRLGIVPSRKTIVGHKEVSATACPQSLNLDVYVEKVKQYYSGKAVVAKDKQAPKETKSVASNEQTSARLLIFDEDLNGYKKGDYLLLNFDRGTYSKVNNKAEVDFIKKQYTGIQTEHVSKGYPVHVRYIQGFKLNKI
ncbi:peptidoglycan recognition protein family protein [Streptococcus parauberis]|uniref:peptidoglycan recognition protein family protein n=1 Tax=Streptococcus parauberis TaxID=1348 RepID=UPI000E301833|nr:peptidoglycan recognition family protein [Streptococcus parauberis]RFE01063.1 N-acetylmuramoyl-L-alanine amidase [Streptococcus parauberis]